jgi:hypothetical protein
MERIRDIAIIFCTGSVLWLLFFKPESQPIDYSKYAELYNESMKRQEAIIKRLKTKQSSYDKIDVKGSNPNYADSLHSDFLNRSGFN